MQKGDIKLLIEIPEDLYIRIKRAKSVPDLTGTDIVNAVLCINRGSEINKSESDKSADTFEKLLNSGFYESTKGE